MFPWRRPSATNYEKVIAEVLLCCTRAETVAWFLQQFTRRFPSWRALARVDRDEIADKLKVIGLWRTRSETLETLAQLAHQNRGRLPADKEELKSVFGIGNYIASAVLMLTHGEVHPLIDSNVERVIRRFFGKAIDVESIAQKLAAFANPVKVNWAVLDFAACICTHNSPKCEECLLRRRCEYAREFGDRSTTPTDCFRGN